MKTVPLTENEIKTAVEYYVAQMKDISVGLVSAELGVKDDGKFYAIVSIND